MSDYFERNTPGGIPHHGQGPADICVTERYFVVSHGDSPHKIFFRLEDAKEYGSRYIDSFGEDGEHLKTYIWRPEEGEDCYRVF